MTRLNAFSPTLRMAILGLGSCGLAMAVSAAPARAQISFPINPFSTRASQPAGEGVVEGRYLSMELEARLLADPAIAGSQPTPEWTPEGWVLKGQFNNQTGRLRAREIMAEVTGEQARDKSRVVVYPTVAPKPMSPAATRVMAQRYVREKFPNLTSSLRCESETAGVIQISGTVLSVEDKLELVRGLHRHKGVVAVENDIGQSPMMRAGKRVILVTQQGDLFLEKLPTSFRQEVVTPTAILQSETSKQPEITKQPAEPQDLPPLAPEVLPEPKGIYPDANPVSKPVSNLVEPTAQVEPSAQNNFIARAKGEDESTLVRTTAASTVSLGQLRHPKRPWSGPSVVTVGGNPIGTILTLNESPASKWQPAHQPKRSRSAELAWQERLNLKIPSAVSALPQPVVSKAVVAKVPEATKPPVEQPASTMVYPGKALTNPYGPTRASHLSVEDEVEPKAPAVLKPVRATIQFEGEEAHPASKSADRKLSAAQLESAVRIACAGLAKKVEILPQGSITLVRVTANDLAAERKALESLVLLPEIHDSAVKLEVVIAR